MKEPKVDFIGIGSLKAATSSVAQLLHEHPEICISVPKEIRYFNTYFRDQEYNKNSNKSLTWYHGHFKHCAINSIKGEFSPNYLTDKDAPRRIFETFPEAKLILCIRNPVNRAYSDYQMLKHYTFRESLSFSQAIRKNPKYLENGSYAKHLERYLEYFDLKNIQVVKFEDFKKNPINEIQKLYHFLGAEPNYLPNLDAQKSNTAKQTKFKIFRKLEYKTKRIVASRGGGKFINYLKEKNVHHLLRKLYTKPLSYPPMNEGDARWLKSQLIEDIEKLEQLLNMDLQSWK